MRKDRIIQASLFDLFSEHEIGRELKAMSAWLDAHREAVIVDALALDPDGKIERVVDWKSDVSPTNAMREKYRVQVRDYLKASGATRGLVVYMTLGLVDQISMD